MATRPYPPGWADAERPARLPQIKLSLIRESEAPLPSIKSADELIPLLTPRINEEHRELFYCVPLSSKNEPLGIHLVSMGTSECALVHPREVFLPAVLSGASSLIVLHNHPSGDPTPSSEDRNVTERLRRAGEILGIKLVDHIVLGSQGFFSFAMDQAIAIPN